MNQICSSPFVRETAELASNLYRLGWDERNAGNISLLLNEEEVRPWLDLSRVLRTIPFDFDARALAGRYFLVTGTGKYFKNVAAQPETCLCVVRIAASGRAAELLWGLDDGGGPTSEFASHMMGHVARLEADPANRIILHSHPTHILAMTFLHELDEASFTHTLWQMCTESIMVFPDGVGVLPWMVCGTSAIGEATAEKFRRFRLVVWAMHGIYGAGRTPDEAFGLIETVDKAAQIYLLTRCAKQLNTISDSSLHALAASLGLTVREDFFPPEPRP